ncbi:hypothetical protein CROQUDRAFT_242575 [Cronartium quercuum f. sp. fusiforme G11]|uniref:BRCT domain-containing protein n=1 Tax=Cronartium quercuum f. sp. fusiforme G11 TaxID=708437 RepID=A0A9P6T973_9BASI|nr:hypothetical protein CROQUDRAFT_242575 [Cronartium quercuum f. sp. fusiforme G11]
MTAEPTNSQASIESELCKDVVFFIDPSVPPLLATQLSALLKRTGAEVATAPTLPQVPPSRNSKVKAQLGPKPQPRFDLLTTTHVITNSVNIPEYIQFGQSEALLGSFLLVDTNQLIQHGHHLEPSQTQEPEDHVRKDPSDEYSSSERYIKLVTPLWVTRSYDLNEVLQSQFYSPDPRFFFSGLTIVIDLEDILPEADRDVIEACVLAGGGQFKNKLTHDTTHFIFTGSSSTKTYVKAMKVREQLDLKVVLPHWFYRCTVLRIAIPEEPFEFPEPPILQPSHLPKSLEDRNVKATLLSEPSHDGRNDDEQIPSATRLSFADQNLSTRPVSAGLSECLNVLTGYPQYDADFLNFLNSTNQNSHNRRAPPHGLVQTHPSFKDKTVYLVSSLLISSSMRESLVQRIQQLGANVYDAYVIASSDNSDQLSTWNNLSKKQQNLALEAEEALKKSDYVICEHRSGWEFWLSLGLDKIIGTLHWIMNILNTSDWSRCVVRSPLDRLLDYPVPADPITNWDPNAKVVTVTNYTGLGRNYIIRLMQKMGLKYTGVLSSESKLLVAASKTGSKVNHAMATGTQIVNHLYIEECFKTWTRAPLEPLHITFPQGVDFFDFVGEPAFNYHDIERWASWPDVKILKKAALAELPSMKCLSTTEVTPNLVPDTTIRTKNPSGLNNVDQQAVMKQSISNSASSAPLSSLWSGPSSEPPLEQSSTEPSRDVSEVQSTIPPHSSDPPVSHSKKRVKRTLISPTPEHAPAVSDDELPTPRALPELGVQLHTELEPAPQITEQLSAEPPITNQSNVTAAIKSKSPLFHEKPEGVHVEPARPEKRPRAKERLVKPSQSRQSNKHKHEMSEVDSPLSDLELDSESPKPEKRSRVNNAAERPSTKSRLPNKENHQVVAVNDSSDFSASDNECSKGFVSGRTSRTADNTSLTPTRPLSRHQTAPTFSGASDTPRTRRTQTENIEEQMFLSKPKTARRGTRRQSNVEADVSMISNIQEGTRATKRLAAQKGQVKLTESVRDMNFHDKEKKRKRPSGSGLPGEEDGGYHGDVKPRLTPKSISRARRGRTSGPSPAQNESNEPVPSTSRGTGRRQSAGNMKDSDEDDDDLPSGSEILRHSSCKRLSTTSTDDRKRALLSESETKSLLEVKGSRRTKKDQSTNAKSGAKTTGVRIVQSGNPSISKKLKNIISIMLYQSLEKLGVKFVEHAEDFTHLLTNEIARKEKLLLAIVHGRPIVSHAWAEACVKAKEILGDNFFYHISFLLVCFD